MRSAAPWGIRLGTAQEGRSYEHPFGSIVLLLAPMIPSHRLYEYFCQAPLAPQRRWCASPLRCLSLSRVSAPLRSPAGTACRAAHDSDCCVALRQDGVLPPSPQEEAVSRHKTMAQQEGRYTRGPDVARLCSRREEKGLTLSLNF